jgi:hypothetical protein
VEGDRFGDVHVPHPVAVGHAEGFVAEVFTHALEASAGHGGLAGVGDRHAPRLGAVMVHLHAVFLKVKSHVRLVQEVVSKILLDDVALVAGADDKIGDAVRGVNFEHVPQDRLSADFDHRLRLQVRLFADSRAKPAGEDNGFHGIENENEN